VSNNLTSKQKSYYFGLFAEIVVMIYLFFTFHRILAWRYKTKFGEIDLVAKCGRNIVFLEVKARKNKDNNEVLTLHQQKRISDAAKIFLQRNKAYSNLNCRFDLIIFNSGLSLKHIKNSW
jgi:putative endonuclease